MLTLLQYLLDQDINFENCRGQTYENTSNISGMQRILKNKNSLVDYITCADHYMNFLGKSAVDYCVEAFFILLLQRLYIFFVASTHHWDVLMTHIKEQPE